MKCSKCGYESNGKFCPNCGSPLSAVETQNTDNTDLLDNKPDDDWTKVCPVCRLGSLNHELKKGLFGLTSKDLFTCSNCNTSFEEKEGKYQLITVNDKSNEIWNDYKGKPLFPAEWQRISRGGKSDEEEKTEFIAESFSRIRSGEVPISGGPDCPVILKKDEEHIMSVPGMKLKEPRSVRRSSGGYGGPRIRIAKGITISAGTFGASSESHEEIRDIDSGTFTLTSRRIIFSGSKKTINIDLLKIISIDPYSDGIAINRENKGKKEYFVNLPRFDMEIGSNERKYTIPFSGVVLMYMIEGLIKRRSNPPAPQQNASMKSTGDSPGKRSNSSKDERFSIQVERNLKGQELEKSGDIERAVKLYEENAAEGFEGNYPYDRLAIIYRKQKRHSDEIRVLERAIFVFENYASPKRGDVAPKLSKFRERLEKAKELEVKNK